LNQESKQDIKAKIRERYKGGDIDNMDVILARPKESIFDDCLQKKVCAYCRVSTDDPRQTSSYELQKNHYEEFIKDHPGWELVEIYADEGITGTSMEKRDEFNRMIADCQKGKIDLIVCKSVARFARNTVDSIQTVRLLLSLKPPIGVFFEAEHMSTLDASSEMMLALLSMTAQEESHNKSEIMNISIEQRFKRGILLTPPLLGYDWDDKHSLTINAQEATTVRLAFIMLLAGFSKKQVAEKLNELQRPSKLGNLNWNASRVAGILRNERYCGDVLARKTFTPNYLTHRSRKNNQDRNQYLWHKQHEPIVSSQIWLAAQTILNICRYSDKGALPVLRVIDKGALQGFVSVSRHQAWDDLDVYVRASLSVYGEGFMEGAVIPDDKVEQETDRPDPTPATRQYLPRGYQVVRAEFLSDYRPTVTLSRRDIRFSSCCYRRLYEPEYIELLLNPVERMLAIRPCAGDDPYAIRWTHKVGNKTGMRDMGAAVFVRTLMDLMGWNSDYRYGICGYAREKEGSVVMFFDLYEPEVRIKLVGKDGEAKELKGYPAEWAGRFGLSAFDRFNSDRLPDENLWGLDAVGQLVDMHELPKYTHDDVAAIVREINDPQTIGLISDDSLQVT